MWFATKNGFKGSALVALCDIFLVKQITERKAQLARCCFQKTLSLKILVVLMFHSFPMLFIPRSYKSIAVPPPQVFGLVGPPKKRVNRDKLNR